MQWPVEQDPAHNTLYHLILNGWPSHTAQVPRITWHFLDAWDELSIKNGILIKGDCICIPPELFDYTLADLHEGHQEVKKMQLLTWASVYWPSTDTDDADYVLRYTLCTQNKATQPIQPMVTCDIPDGLWQNIAANYFIHNGKRLPLDLWYF